MAVPSHPPHPPSTSSRRRAKCRLDTLLVERGLADSRTHAQALILAGRVEVDGKATLKAGSLVPPDAQATVAGDPRPFVSRGGEKLAAALDQFKIDPTGLSVLDLGASTGGFTDCVLQRGAARVVAVDVGHGQFAWELRHDPRIDLRERTNARTLRRNGIDAPFDLAVVDLSFISVRHILPVLAELLDPQGRAVVLVKPQFEVGKGQVGKGGVVRDKQQHAKVLQEVGNAARHAGFEVLAAALSVLRGAKGNREFFLHLWRRRTSGAGSSRSLEAFLAIYLTDTM